jgi:predicted DNA-binding transcriptional regulator AlpA
MDDNRLEPEDILTPTQLAKRLQVSLNWVYEKTRRRKLANPMPHLKLGRYLRFFWPDICAWMRTGAAT